MVNKLLLFLLFILSAVACNKSSSNMEDTQPPRITIATPVAGQVFTAGQPINITGSINDNNYIAEVHIHVTNNNTGALLMDVHLYPAAADASFSQSITAVAGINYRITVTAKDKAVNEGRSSVDVSAN